MIESIAIGVFCAFVLKEYFAHRDELREFKKSEEKRN